MLDGRGAQPPVVELDAEVAEAKRVMEAVRALDAPRRDVAGLHAVQQHRQRQAETFGDLLDEEVRLVARDVFAQLDGTTRQIFRTCTE